MAQSLIIAVCLVLLGAIPTFAKPWRGIVALHSTRDDVRKLLGTPRRHDDYYDDYQLRGYSVRINYAVKDIFNPSDDCDGPAPYWWGVYHVAPGTVLSIEVEFDEVLLTKLKMRKLNHLAKGPPDSTLAVDYFNKRRGLQYSIRFRKLYRVTYGPSAVADARVRCAPDPDADARERRVNEICARLFGPMIDSGMRLYAVNPSYVLHLTFDRHGEVVALHVEPKYLYDWWHPDWEKHDDFQHLSKPEYERLLAQVDQIKPRGALVDMPVTTDQEGHREQHYGEGLLRWEEITSSRPSDAPRIRLFTFYYLKQPAT